MVYRPALIGLYLGCTLLSLALPLACVLGAGLTRAFAAALSLSLLLALGVTSFNAVKKRMKTESWKRLQRLAYAFFALVYVHLLLMLLPSALHGGQVAQASVAVYSVVFVAYFVLRVARALLDRRATQATPAMGEAPAA